MEYSKNKIEQLLNLYEEGKTTLEEERFLKSYFASSRYDSDFEAYALLFKTFDKESSYTLKEELKTKTPSKNHSWMTIAASILVVFGTVWFYNYNEKLSEIEEAQLMFENTQQALNLVSQTMNTGLQKLEYVEIFSTHKNQLLK